MKKQKRRIRGPLMGALVGVFCFVLLAVLLYGTQIFVSYEMEHNNAITELTQLRDKLIAQSMENEYEQFIEDLLRKNTQKAVLLLDHGEITNQALADVQEQLTLPCEMIVFREDGTVLSSYGNAVTNPDFLSLLADGGVQKAENGVPFFATRLRDDLYLATGSEFYVDGTEYQEIEYDMNIVETLSSSLTGNVAVVNSSNGRVLYGPADMVGRKMENFHVFTIEGAASTPVLLIGRSFMVAAVLEYGNYQLMSLFDIMSIVRNLHVTIIPALLGFGFLIILLIAYTKFLRTDMRRGRLGKIHYTQFGKKRYLNTMLLRKLVGFAVIGIAVMVCVVYCLQLLIRSDEQRENAEHRLNIAARIVEESQNTMSVFEELDTAILTEQVREVKSMIEFNPNLVSEAGLNSMARLFGAEGICVLDEAGKTVATTTNFQDYVLGSNSSDGVYPFWDVINGFAENHVQIIKNDPYCQEKDMVYAGIPNEHGRGMILYIVGYDAYRGLQKMFDVGASLADVGVDSQSILLAVKAGTTTCAFDSSNQYTGLSLQEYGIQEAYLRNGYSGTHRFDGKDSLINTRSFEGWHLLYITPTSQISANSWVFTIMAIVLGLLVVIIAVVPRLMVREPGEDMRVALRKERSARQRTHVDAVLDRDGQIELVESQVERHTLGKRWSKMNANAKLGALVRFLMAALGGCLLIFFLFGRHSGKYPVLDRILAQNWDKTLNVYAVSYVAIVVVGIWIIAEMLENVTLFVTGTFSRRWKTTGILLNNVIRYAALIISLFFSLKNFGVQTSALATSASVLTLIFGLGCQNFVADLVAGVFLLFEGAFRVGDIVVIDGWHGEVVEIGLRSTKVKNEIGNVKVFQNSRISGAVNMTRDQTFAVCDIPLPPGEKLEAYENKLTTGFFPEAMKNIESLRHPLVYEGVVAMNGDSATLRFSVKCLEHEREQIKRDLYRELKLWREQNA